MEKVSNYNYTKAGDYIQVVEKALHENVGFYVDGQWKEIKTADIKSGAPHIAQFKDKIQSHITNAKIDEKYAIAMPELPKQNASAKDKKAYETKKTEFLNITKAAKEEISLEILKSKNLIAVLETITGEFEKEGTKVTYDAHKLVKGNDIIFLRFPVLLQLAAHHCHNSIMRVKKAAQQQNDAKDIAALLNLNSNNPDVITHNEDMDQELEALFADL